MVDPRGERTDERPPQIVMWRTLVKSKCMCTEGQTNKDTSIQKSCGSGVLLDRGATVHLVFGWWRILRRVDCVEKVGERRFIYELRIEPTKEGNVV